MDLERNGAEDCECRGLRKTTLNITIDEYTHTHTHLSNVVVGWNLILCVDLEYAVISAIESHKCITWIGRLVRWNLFYYNFSLIRTNGKRRYCIRVFFRLFHLWCYAMDCEWIHIAILYCIHIMSINIIL